MPTDGTRAASMVSGTSVGRRFSCSSRTSIRLPAPYYVGRRNAKHNGGSKNYVLVRVEGVARNRPVNHLVLTTLRKFRKFRKLTAAFLVKIRPSISK